MYTYMEVLMYIGHIPNHIPIGSLDTDLPIKFPLFARVNQL